MEEKHISPLKAIRLKCLDCCCGSSHEVKLCPCTKCSLYHFRFGKNPNRAGMTNNGSFAAQNNGSTNDLQNSEYSEGTYIPEVSTEENAY